jgi:hypothetical protein
LKKVFHFLFSIKITLPEKVRLELKYRYKKLNYIQGDLQTIILHVLKMGNSIIEEVEEKKIMTEVD